MTQDRLETDYLVVGAGAAGLAFADSLLAESGARIAIVDERARPGGHWNDAYRFVRLHQPSINYGVNSMPLGSGALDAAGPNAGCHELATGMQVCAYFEEVMERALLPTGRVDYLPLSRYEEGGRIVSLVTGEARSVHVRRRIVDTTYVAGTVPSRHVPGYRIAEGVRHIAVNGLAMLEEPAGRYVVIGGGKTGMDACLFLLERGLDPDAIVWIVPQDAWLVDRATIQPGEEFYDRTVGNLIAQMEAAAAATSVDDLFLRLEAAGALFRLDPAVMPTAYRCATINAFELAQLRRIRNVVRLGRVAAIEKDRIRLARGEIATDPGTIHVDCSAKGIAPRPARPIFAGERITMQFVRTCQPTFSAAFIAFVEAHFEDEARKNELCGVIRSPESVLDWLTMTLGNAANSYKWSREAKLQPWLLASRLNGFKVLMADESALSPPHAQLRARLSKSIAGAMANLQRLAA
ncbi:MAG: NAD(P)-binding protein [Alphaproteobacteria bacterium]|nr:NAD(P)-binding protein [Alphaproteobacteria bacterium]